MGKTALDGFQDHRSYIMKKTESDITATTPSSTYDTPQALEKPTNAKLPIVTSPSPLAIELAGLKTAAANLARELANQKVRLADIARLTDEKAGLLESIADEITPYMDGSAKLATVEQNVGVLEWSTKRKGAAVVAELHHLRQQALDLKNSVLARINAAAGIAVQTRQEEISGIVAGWNGTTAPVSPLPVSLIVSTCPTAAKLEAHRVTLEAAKMEKGLSTLAAAMEPALAFLATVTAPEPHPQKLPAYIQRSHFGIYAWNGDEPRMDLIATFDNRQAAQEHFLSLRHRSGFCGYVKAVIFAEATPQREIWFSRDEFDQVDKMQNSAAAALHTPEAGTTAEFITTATAWLKA